MATNRQRWWWRRKRAAKNIDLSILWKWIILMLVKCVKAISVHKASALARTHARTCVYALFKHTYCRIVSYVRSNCLLCRSVIVAWNWNVNTKLTNRDISFRFSFLVCTFLHQFEQIINTLSDMCHHQHHMFRWSVLVICEPIWVCCASAESFHYLRRQYFFYIITVFLWCFGTASAGVQWDDRRWATIIWEAEQWEFRCFFFFFKKKNRSRCM